jgi:hypothetical protein
VLIDNIHLARLSCVGDIDLLLRDSKTRDCLELILMKRDVYEKQFVQKKTAEKYFTTVLDKD